MKAISPITLFLLVSTGIHAGFVVQSYTNNITLPGSTGSVMVVQIKNTSTQKQVLDYLEKQELSKKPILHKKSSNIKTNKQPNKSETTLTNKDPAKSKARVASIIYKELNQYFTYPRLAVKRNWQGKVLLSLRVTSSGKIKNIQLNQSSGYEILDQAAMNSLSKVDNLPEISSWLPFDIDIEFPVVYKLIEG